jgi:hypothetical protein
MSWIDEIESFLGMGGGWQSVAPPYLDPSQVANQLNLVGAGGGGTNIAAFGPTSGGGGGWGSWIPSLQTLLEGLGLYEGISTTQNQMNANQNAYNTWQQQQARLLAQGQQLMPQQLADWQQLWQQWQQNQAIQRQAALTAMNPTLMGQRAAAATQPINARLASDVIAAADAKTAGRGMAQAPGAVAGAEASALAPFAQQNLQIGANLASNFGPATSLPTASGAPPLVDTLQGLQSFTPSTVNAPPDMLSILNQLRNFASGPYTLPQGVLS